LRRILHPKYTGRGHFPSAAGHALGTIAIGIPQRYQKFEIITAPVRGKSNILHTRIIILEELS
jgi:hypothetical protein